MRSKEDKSQISHRCLKVSEQLRREIAVIFQEANFRNEELYDTMVMVTEVNVSPDLQNANVYILPLGSKPQKDVVKQLSVEAPYIRHLVSQKLNMRTTPALKFSLDHTFNQAAHMETLLKDPKVQQDLTLNSMPDETE
jgi:ribosome-binding factor A